MTRSGLPSTLILALTTACGAPFASSDPAGGTTGGPDDDVDAGATTGEAADSGPVPLCADPMPLAHGDAVWGKAPFMPPSEGNAPDDPDNGGGGEDGAGGFIENPDGGGVSFECDLFSQDCPEGEKCASWANDGGQDYNATRCSPLAPEALIPGDTCTVQGSQWSGLDDCQTSAMCWDVDRRTNLGTCIAMCEGSEADPMCPPESWCYLGNQGSLAVCLDESLCADDGSCQCMCPEGEDPDCTPEQCAEKEAEHEDPREAILAEVPIYAEEDESSCPEDYDPIDLFMSNDDSNSQASPILARQYIERGYVVPFSVIRLHEFLNYYDFAVSGGDDDAPASVGIQMRRTDAEAGEFTLVVTATGQRLSQGSRPPMNLVFSLDTSGSMGGDPLERLKDTMSAFAGSLRDGDVVSVVTWSTEQAVELAGYEVAGPDDPELVGLIESLQSGGGTDLHSGLVAAYGLANEYEIEGGLNRVVLISDGGANVGVTDEDLIGSEAADEDGEGIYMIGVGVNGDPLSYNDALMDVVTDAGKGAYVYVDSTEEAERQFGDNFLANVAVSARNVRLKLTLPWYFGIKAFHGEEYSPVAEEVEPQHLAPNDSMVFHQIIGACDASHITTCDEIVARVDYTDPLTGEEDYDEVRVPVGDVVEAQSDVLRKSDVIVGYGKALIVIAHLANASRYDDAAAVATNMQEWAAGAAKDLDDAELTEIAALMGTYAENLAALAPEEPEE